MPAPTLTQDYEDVVDAAVSFLVQRLQDITDALGPAPFGWVKANKYDLLETYLENRDNPQFWQQMLTAYTLQVGEGAAVAKVVSDTTRLERMLAKEGLWDGSPETLQAALAQGAQVVRGQQALRRLGIAERGMKAAEKELAKPQALVSGPLPVVSEQAMVMGGQAA